MPDVWRKSQTVWKPRVVQAAEVLTKAVELKEEVGEKPWIGKVLSFAESQIVKKSEPPKSSKPFVGGKTKQVGTELSAAIKEGSRVDDSGDVKGFRPQPSPASSNAGSRPDSQEKDEAEVWVAQGDWKNVSNSRDVYAIRYEIKSGSLFVQFKHWDPDMAFAAKDGPGPIYEYSDVSIPEARSAYKTKNIDEWLKDRVVGRGGANDSIKPYRFVSGSKGYTPRKATTKNGREWYEPRRVWRKGDDSTLPPGPNLHDDKTRSKSAKTSHRKGKKR